MLIDSHCHLDGPKFDADRDAVIARAIEAGVTAMLTIGTGDGPPDLGRAVRLAEAHPAIFASAGVHPHDAGKWDAACAPALRQLSQHPKLLAIGEIGLDYHYDFSPREKQVSVFIEQMAIAAAARLPIIIHTREAWDDTFRLLDEYWKPTGLGGIMHCFSGGPPEAVRSVALGFLVSFSGLVTYAKAPEVRQAAALVPPEMLLVETDAPYLAPVPHRGKRNEPAMVVKTAEAVAQLRGSTFESIASITTENFFRLFPKAAGLQGSPA